MANWDVPDTTPLPLRPLRAGKDGGWDKARPIQSLYVVEEHERGLHYDFRLQFDDMTACWAIPEHPSPIPGDKRLAIRTPEPETCHGILWDTGTVELLNDLTWHHALAEGRLALRLNGERLHGVFVMVRAHRSPDQEQWLLITKETEPSSDAGAVTASVEERR
ncbi:DNA polymerase ligase N-terminal domain-containing protein [Saccharomonospora glauca]|uniref:DNA ligase D 3'-phosphoesterase domain-containing protein n=1 Tax=Saccharomonospora glauca K62 TaxID=928724 RepID=I1CWX8_9PSEU|nr:DNA polymerase ligase N-terminal domain-containing protein [Saccharomonospora glauca]EIE97202.1 hypothetical protein SacglDRAFT_00241 [Saccharomonospora glauca K62]